MRSICSHRLRVLFLPLFLSGCAATGASSFILVGAYFPAWLLCAVAGLIAAVGTRVMMLVTGLSNILPLQLFVCLAAGLLMATAAWLFWFGR